MSEWAPKRFWKSAEVTPQGAGWAVTLDGRPVRTPAKTPLVVPTEALARQIAAEWDAQEARVNPATMPFTRMSNSALDKVTLQHAEVADMLGAYGDADLLCYRADHPEELVSRQADAWDPVLDWAGAALGARLVPRLGVIHAPQDAAALARLSARVHTLDAFRLAAFHDLVSLTGSLILGFATAERLHDPDTLWSLSRIDETWQAEQWGADEEAQATAEYKRGEFNHAATYFQLANPGAA
ncbi:ATP12 family chaperone protein [Thetidibacter halocola]|uniref:ATPase n=1 Tax=Thetidibacter halocola TaxID=2827239 RepID=A0A8J7WHX0_9RHOB|nr:ATP12 family protein [Thetidibacter halocola]MBS0125633.1 ATPase [Thetidibacter halocola]